ncbi:hypothetical protein BT69DRAFT_639517 [Atractiella rhizophila]|nr:hypothetical protein BT69DRAFT_639517 [Atractiella rhizophila]
MRFSNLTHRIGGIAFLIFFLVEIAVSLHIEDYAARLRAQHGQHRIHEANAQAALFASSLPEPNLKAQHPPPSSPPPSQSYHPVPTPTPTVSVHPLTGTEHAPLVHLLHLIPFLFYPFLWTFQVMSYLTGPIWRAIWRWTFNWGIPGFILLSLATGGGLIIGWTAGWFEVELREMLGQQRIEQREESGLQKTD